MIEPITPVKIRRVAVQAFTDPEQTPLNGRFYFPDIPELNNTTIVGIEFIPGWTGTLQNYYLPQNFGAEYTVNGNPCFNANYLFAQNFTLTMKNENNQYIIENFPILQLWNKNPASNTRLKKIWPFNFKTILKDSFVYCQSFTPGIRNSILQFQFHYLD